MHLPADAVPVYVIDRVQVGYRQKKLHRTGTVDLEMAESERDVSYAHIFDGRYDVLDHVFVSQELYFRNPQAKLTVRSTRIFNDHLVDSRRTQREGRGPSMRCDHGVPVTELWWRSPD